MILYYVVNILQRLQSPMHIAAEQGFTEICKLLLAAGANIQQREQVGFNLNGLIYAIHEHNMIGYSISGWQNTVVYRG